MVVLTDRHLYEVVDSADYFVAPLVILRRLGFWPWAMKFDERVHERPSARFASSEGGVSTLGTRLLPHNSKPSQQGNVAATRSANCFAAKNPSGGGARDSNRAERYLCETGESVCGQVPVVSGTVLKSFR